MSNKGKHLTAEQVRSIVDMIASGKRLKDIAAKMGVSYSTVRNISAKEPEAREQARTFKTNKAEQKPLKKVYTSRIRNERPVEMFDNKGTIKFVREDDTRTDDQIRDQWRETKLKELKSLKLGRP